ncbi:MAG: HutD family protein [Pseudomonadota bacterium]|nr:HutD family protein [Pseudomonadota bacterium]
MLQRLPAPLLRDEPWANGAGTTTVLAIGPDPLAWQWRISIARDDRAAAFSVYPDTLRQLTPLDGRLQLRFSAAHAPATMAIDRLQVVRFDGAAAPRAALPDGPTRVFNLMTRAGTTATLLARPLVGALLLPDAPRWFVHVFAGNAELHQTGDDRLDLQIDDSAWASGACRLSGHGEIVLARFDEISAADPPART